uniref:RRM domain-containing protein n=1 Tax=Aegilops tauschii TaxID=37682 RepID=M8CV61_AEGTA
MAYFCTLSGEDLSLSLPTRGDERTRALAGHMASAVAPEEGAGAKNVDEGNGSAVGRPSRHRALRPDAAERGHAGTPCHQEGKAKGRQCRGPLAGADRLELTVAMAQLTAFTRWRGTRGLPVYTACHGIDDIADGVREGTLARRATKRGRPKGDNAEGKRKMSRYCTCDGSASESADDPLEMELESYEPRPRPVSHQTTTKMGKLMSQAARRMSLSPVSHIADPQANASAGVMMTRCTGAAAAPSVKLQNGGLNKDEPLLTGLSLNFSGPDTVPPASDLVKIFSKFGPVVEARPEGLTVSMVIFKRKLDAEVAFSSTPKIRALDPNLVSYRLAYSLPAPTPVDSPQSPMNTDEMDHLFVDDDEALQ